MLGNVGRRAAAAGWIEYKIARVGRHQEAAFDDSSGSLNNVSFILSW